MLVPIATLTSNLGHGPPVMGPPYPKVLINKKPSWRVGDMNVCAIPNAPPPVGPGTPHGPGITMPPGKMTLLIGKKPAAKLGDIINEPGAIVPLPPPDPIVCVVPTKPVLI